MSSDVTTAVNTKLNEDSFLMAPVEQAMRELQLHRGMLRARAEEEIHALSPALATLSEALEISTLDLLTAPDRSAFLADALHRSQLSIDTIRERLLACGESDSESLKVLGLPEAS